MDGSSSNQNFILGYTIQCYDCHDYHGSIGGINNVPDNALFSKTDTGGTEHRPQNIAFGFRKNGLGSMAEDPPGGTVPGYYENKPPYTVGSSNYGARKDLRVDNVTQLTTTGGHYFKYFAPSGTVKIGDKLPCNDCHDPHQSDGTTSKWQAFIRKTWPQNSRVASQLGTTEAVASSLMANAPASGISSDRSDDKSRKLCAMCHGYSGTDWDNVMASEINTAYVGTTIVRPPAWIYEHKFTSSGGTACVSCHNHNSVDVSCSQCHGFPPSNTASPAYPAAAGNRFFVPVANPADNDSHPRHYGAKSGGAANSFSQYSFNCDVCHYGSYGTGAALGKHQDNLVSVVLQGAWTKNGGTYDNTNYFNPTYGYDTANLTGHLDNSANAGGWGRSTGPNTSGWNQCRNVYCHSAGRDQTSMALDCTVLYPRPTWNSGALHCNDCHGYGTDNSAVKYPNGAIDLGMPGYASGTPGSTTANSHFAHVVTNKMECYFCHAGTVDNNYSGATRRIRSNAPTKHVNGVREVEFDGVNAINGSRTPPYAADKTCSVNCHGNDLPKWGGTLTGGCFACHSGTEQPSKPQYDYGTSRIPNPVDNLQYLSSGHGLSQASNYPGPDNNTGAGFNNTANDNNSDCYYCHSRSAAHIVKDTADPFRLGYGSDATGQKNSIAQGAFADNTDDLCLHCHGATASYPAATKASTRNMATHSKAITGGTRTWPVTPWKCVDCHDPHGDNNWMMVRSGISAPTSGSDSSAGSDGKSRPNGNGANVVAVSFTSTAGFADNSYAVPGVGNWGICEVCHNQTTDYSRTKDNSGSHGTRTNRCTTCHPHSAGFGPKACKGCHGPDGVATAQRAPNVGAYWTTSGHGMKAPAPKTIDIQCEACHDTSSPPGTHKTDGSPTGDPPWNLNTLNWPVTKTLDCNTSPNVNTAHLVSSYFPTGTPANKYEYALAFDRKCGNPVTGCHPAYAHNHKIHPKVPAGSTNPADNVLTFDNTGNLTVANPKQYYWYLPVILTATEYGTRFYESPSPWVIGDLTTSADNASLSGSNIQYGVCVSCHDPHGTLAPVNIPGATTNLMLRGNSKNQAQFCNYVCHGSRTPP